jgi:hypothetical protein
MVVMVGLLLLIMTALAWLLVLKLVTVYLRCSPTPLMLTAPLLRWAGTA